MQMKNIYTIITALFLFLAGAAPAQAACQELAGTWKGTCVNLPGFDVDLIVDQSSDCREAKFTVYFKILGLIVGSRSYEMSPTQDPMNPGLSSFERSGNGLEVEAYTTSYYQADGSLFFSEYRYTEDKLSDEKPTVEDAEGVLFRVGDWIFLVGTQASGDCEAMLQ